MVPTSYHWAHAVPYRTRSIDAENAQHAKKTKRIQFHFAERTQSNPNIKRLQNQKTYDFSTLYTKLPMTKILESMLWLVDVLFKNSGENTYW